MTPAADTLVASGDTVRLTAEAADANGHAVAGPEFAWASSDTLVATVDGSGLVRGVSEGTATITATAGSAQGTARITVANSDTTIRPFHGTASLDPGHHYSIGPNGFPGPRARWPGRAASSTTGGHEAWITIQAYLFDATFANGLSAEFQVNPEFGTWTEAEAAARAYAPSIGQIPLRSAGGHGCRMDTPGRRAVWRRQPRPDLCTRIAANNTGNGASSRRILVHEGVHVSLDSTHADATGWLAAQAADPTFISTYARDYPDREDLAESFSAWLAVRHRSDRITEGMADTITSAIPHRLAYFDSLDLNLCPVALEKGVNLGWLTWSGPPTSSGNSMSSMS